MTVWWNTKDGMTLSERNHFLPSATKLSIWAPSGMYPYRIWVTSFSAVRRHAIYVLWSLLATHFPRHLVPIALKLTLLIADQSVPVKEMIKFAKYLRLKEWTIEENVVTQNVLWKLIGGWRTKKKMGIRLDSRIKMWSNAGLSTSWKITIIELSRIRGYLWVTY